MEPSPSVGCQKTPPSSRRGGWFRTDKIKGAYTRLADRVEDAKDAIADKVEAGKWKIKEKVGVNNKRSAPSAIMTKAEAFVEGWRDMNEAGLRHATQFVLRTTGRMVKEAAKPPYMPDSLLQAVEPYIDEAWDTVEKSVTRQVLLRASPKQMAFRELRVHFWPPPPTSTCSARWLRAHFLYAMHPADGNMWKSLHSPISVSLIALRVQPFGFTSVALYLLMFFLIDRTDEYQLVNYILKFKGFHFVSGGLFGAVYLGSVLFDCLVEEWRGRGSYCLAHAPGAFGLFRYAIVVRDRARRAVDSSLARAPAPRWLPRR